MLLPLFIVILAALALTFLWESAFRAALARGRLKQAVERRRAMTEQQIRDALRVDDDDPLWLATHQLLEDMILDATGEATDADNLLKPPLPAYYAGAAAHLQRFRDFLKTEREKALQEALNAD